jgi:hypothetical protein
MPPVERRSAPAPQANLLAPSAEALSLAIAFLMVVQAGGGLLLPGLYRDLEEWMLAAWFGNDLVTLFVAVPLLVGSVVLARQGSTRGELVWYGALGYAVYNYGFCLFGARLNAFFPLYALLFVAPVLALILLLGRLDAAAVAEEFRARVPLRWISGYMLLTGGGLGVAWLAQWAAFVFRGVEPGIGEEPFALIAALDLSFVVPFFLLGGLLLWKRRPWGFVLAPIVIVKGATYTLVLTVSSSVAWMWGIEGAAGQVPVWGAWTVVGAAALVLLLRGVRS